MAAGECDLKRLNPEYLTQIIEVVIIEVILI